MSLCLLLFMTGPLFAGELKFCKESPSEISSLRCVVKIAEEVKVYVGSDVFVYSENEQWVVAVGEVVFRKGSFIIARFDDSKEPMLEKGQTVLFYNPTDKISHPLL